MRKITKKTKYALILLSLLFLVSLGTGIYFLFKEKASTFAVKTVNKYSEILNFCDYGIDNENLNVNCKALLKDIRTTGESDTCFDMQILSKGKELKDLTVCEKNDNLSYTNDVLGYKKLMPIDMIFTYTKEGILGDYSFNNVSFTKVDDTYVQSIVNEDIADLVTIDSSTTTIQNSVDFCPKPETLPSYVTEVNKAAYSNYLSKNTLTEEKYMDPLLYSWDDTTLRLLYACDSSKNMGYTGICNDKKVINTSPISADINHIYATPAWNNTLNDKNIMLLKEISLLYDNMYSTNVLNNLVNLSLLKNLVDTINTDSNLNEEVLCGMYKIYNGLATQNSKYISDRNMIQNLFSTETFNTATCSNILPEFNTDKDKNGIYIKKYYSNLQPSLMTIYSRCQNLANIVLY